MTSVFKAWCRLTDAGVATDQNSALELKLERQKAMEAHLQKENTLLKESIDEYRCVLVVIYM